MTRRDLGTSRWKRIRQTVLDRDGHECQIRGRGCKGTANTVDHIVPHNLGGGDDPGNLRAACRPCNSSLASRAKVQRPRQGGGVVSDTVPPPSAALAEVSLAGPVGGRVKRRTHRQVPG
jgi:hypothetical protein